MDDETKSQAKIFCLVSPRAGIRYYPETHGWVIKMSGPEPRRQFTPLHFIRREKKCGLLYDFFVKGAFKKNGIYIKYHDKNNNILN